MIINQSKALIALATENGSICELSKMSPNSVQGYNDEFGTNIKNVGNCFFFNRLKAARGTKGEDTALMKELVKILDTREASVILEVNPHGDFKLKELLKLYQKFGFVLVDKDKNAALMRWEVV